jgi:hypothetical protein
LFYEELASAKGITGQMDCSQRARGKPMKLKVEPSSSREVYLTLAAVSTVLAIEMVELPTR